MNRTTWDNATAAFRNIVNRLYWLFLTLGIVGFAFRLYGGVTEGVSNDVKYYLYSAFMSVGVAGWSDPWAYPPLAGAISFPLQFFTEITSANVYWVLGLMATSTLITMWALWRTGLPGRKWVMVYVLYMATALHLIYTNRIEPITVMTTVLALLAFSQGKDIKSGVWLTIGGLIKAWPFLMLPVLGVVFGRWKVLATAAAILIPMTVVGFITSAYPWSWITFAQGRPLHVESIAALPALWAVQFGDTAYHIEHLWYGSVIYGPWLKPYGTLLLILVFGSIIAAVTWKARHLLFRPNSHRWNRHQAAYLTMVIAGTMMASPVLSPQFILWLAPIAMVALLRRWLVLESVLLLVAAGISGVQYPWLYYGLLTISDTPAILPLLSWTVRDLCLFALVVIPAYRLTKHAAKKEAAAAAVN